MKTLLLALLLALAPPLAAQTTRIALIGDTPYNDGERRLLPGMFEQIAGRGAQLIIHIGDFKSGGSICSDEIFANRRNLFDDSPLPFVFVPGDNDWADCHRTSNGGYNPLERLDRLRQLFFAEPLSLGRRPIQVERQSAETPEHLRWKLGPVRFVTLNVPGGNNNWGTRSAPSQEYRQRLPKVLGWLREGFRVARDEKARVIVIALQANPDFHLYTAGTPNGSYRELLDTLRDETRRFPGEVIFVHGDTHHQRIDRPLRDSADSGPLPNFTRIETFGAPFMGWTELEIDSKPAVPIRIEAHSYSKGSAILP